MGGVGDRHRVADAARWICGVPPDDDVGGEVDVGRITATRMVTRVTVGEAPRREPDTLAGEEPLELRVGGRSLAVTMRTPGADFDLAAGFLVSEGVVTRREELVAMRYCAGKDETGQNSLNVLDLTLAPGVAAPDDSVARAFFTTSSCGLCGKASIDAVRTRSAFTVADDPLRVTPEFVAGLPDQLRAAQRLFETTGGLHAAGLFDAASGELLALREDVGRHNAVDKVVGWALREGMVPMRGSVLLVSGRASFELVQKALMAGIPMLCAVSAPSSLAADMAEESGMTLVGFLRGPSFVVYAGADRLVSADQLAGSSP
ncbi:MAG TPA: formate dehydrogenase accessory sulfurtransferase FdhD [Acidimicrobiales bacterium]|nr:formate dehydrogenase accessory sulfurtransferase FdhD [Acidimicrobiales bacterium]